MPEREEMTRRTCPWCGGPNLIRVESNTLQDTSPAPSPIRSMREDEDGYISWQQMNEKALAEHDAAIAAQAREDFANQLKTNVNCMHEMKDFAQCGHCPYRKCKDNGYYDCDIDKVLRGSTKEITP